MTSPPPNPRPKVFLRAVITALLALFLMILLWPWLVLEPHRQMGTQQDMVWDSLLRIDNPHQTIRTADTVYDLAAERLQVMSHNNTEVLLIRPKIMMTHQNGSWMTLHAKSGVYNKESRILRLIAEVRIEDSRGSDLRTESAIMRLNERTAEGHSPITGRLGQMEVRAAGFEAHGANTEYRLLGPSALVMG